MHYPLLATTLRLRPDEDVKTSLIEYVQKHKLSAVTVVSVVGSVKSLHLRLASGTTGGLSNLEHKFIQINQTSSQDHYFEIVSFVGTLEYDSIKDNSYAHLHGSFSDHNGQVIGGHILPGCIVQTTAEITMIIQPMLTFSREMDTVSGYKELNVHPNKNGFSYFYCVFMYFTDYIRCSYYNISSYVAYLINEVISTGTFSTSICKDFVKE